MRGGGKKDDKKYRYFSVYSINNKELAKVGKYKISTISTGEKSNDPIYAALKQRYL